MSRARASLTVWRVRRLYSICARGVAWRATITGETPTRFGLEGALTLSVAVALVNAIAIVQALNLYHALAVGAPAARGIALSHGRLIFDLEQRLHLAVEPRVQQAFAGGIGTPLGGLPGATLRRLLAWLYLHAFPAWLFAALAWSYVYKQRQFPLLRDVTIVSALLSVACYRFFPVAPPRFVLALAPYHLQDWTYGGSAIGPPILQVGVFNPYAAFPSVHLLWALIPALCLAIDSRRAWVWCAALCFPLVMGGTVVSTGNHYVLDCAGSLAILALSCVIVGIARRAKRRIVGERPLVGERPFPYERPAALCLCLCCAGILAIVGAQGGVRLLIAAAILLLIVGASARSVYLWPRRRRLGPGRQRIWASDYLSGILFIAGASAAAARPGHLAVGAPRLCALLWLFACVSALAKHVVGASARAHIAGGESSRRHAPWSRQRADSAENAA